MNTRFLPGMLAPRYHELAFGKRVVSATSRTCSTQASSASSVASMASRPLLRCIGCVGDPFDVLLDSQGHVGQHRRAARPGHDEHVRESGDLEAQVGDRARRPLVGQGEAVAAPNVDLQGAGHGVEAGGEDDGVEFVQVRSSRCRGPMRVIGVARADRRESRCRG